MASQARGMQQVAVLVQNENGAPMVGSTIAVTIDGVSVGEMTSSGESTVEFEEGSRVELEANAGPFVTRALVEPGASRLVMVVPTQRFIELAAIPTARCPDGTVGQPCVTCTAQGRTVRICA